MAFIVVSCHDSEQKIPVTRDSFADMTLKKLHVSEEKIRNNIGNLMFEDKDMQAADLQTKKHYQNNGPLLWISRCGVRNDADSVVKYASRVKELGFATWRFRVDDIASDIRKVRTLQCGDENINMVFARLEYNLTKAYLRYCVGQRFGYTNPRKLFNRLDIHDSDSVHVSYQTLFDVPIKTPDSRFIKQALQQIAQDSASMFMKASKPEGQLYNTLLEKLHTTRSAAERMRIMVNMERCRWNVADKPGKHSKYVLLNIPSQELDAIDGDEHLNMRVVCGSMKTKTPLLNSYIERIDINPQWIIPKSIIKKSVARHAGNAGYFETRRYFIRERKTGKIVNPAVATPQMLTSNDYLVIQKGGKGNALGRIIFRFKNNFSVYLHDTSNPTLFSSSDRLASHGCVRVQRPYDLAAFLIGSNDNKLLEKIRYSISVDMPDGNNDTNNDGEKTEERVDKSMLVRSAKVSPAVPLYITYFTLYKSAKGSLLSYPDIYGYDSVISEALKRYM